MNGLELSRAYYEAFGRPMLENEFSHLLPYLAVGFTGRGSEHYGFDDEISRDHDYEPGFCLFLPGEAVVSRRDAFLLERAYAKLPKEFDGCRRSLLAPVGGARNGVLRISDFFTAAVGDPDGVLTVNGWLTIPDYVLAEAVNGEIFFDHYGEITEIRDRLAHMPEDVRRKRLAGQLLLMGQAGQYNFARCIAHGEPEAAQLACGEFVSAALKAAFLMESRYLPYYKWSFRALRTLDGGRDLAAQLSLLLAGDHHNEAVVQAKQETIEAVAALFSDKLRAQSLSSLSGAELERHAYAVNDTITDGDIRNLHILVTV